MPDRKNCIDCKHFCFAPGDYGYSDWTPGYPPEITCLENVWRIDLNDCDEEDYRKCLLTANTCKKYIEDPSISEVLEKK